MKERRDIFLLSFFLFLTFVDANVYLHNPRGSNDRLNEEGDRQNAQRLFDSENNARGGYCWGPALTYVEGSILPIEWAASLGTRDVSSTHILQYLCTDSAGDYVLRDGTTIQTITTVTSSNIDDPNYYNYIDPNVGGYKFGMHENITYYQACRARDRNKGLFVGEEIVHNGMGAMATRQNPSGQRYGFECSEERDYFPYWHPSPWKDIAVITTEPENCPFYQAESQNVKAKHFCSGSLTGAGRANNEDDCLLAGGQWVSTPAFGIPAPACQPAEQASLDHITKMQRYTWTLPTSAQEPCIATGCNCAVRIRLNVTSAEVNGVTGSFLDSLSPSPVSDDPTIAIDQQRFLTLAMDTSQTGRVFQDRSFMFHIRPRLAIPSTAKIYNLNVRGKRGNLVQTFPATEYAFSPETLNIESGDYVHFQWTGCDTNSANAAGNGRVKTDRSNIVQIASLNHNIPLLNASNPLFQDVTLRTRMAYLDQVNCKTQAQLQQDQNNGIDSVEQNPQNCFLLNAASPNFDGGVVQFSSVGSFSFMSTRNNFFSNRNQKGQINVHSPPTVPPTPSTSIPE